DDLRDFKKFGKPRLFFGVTAGNMDSMVNHYTANKRLRSNDAYTPGGRAGQRPDYPSLVYTHILKDLFPDVPVLLGGVEASQRRFTHYDFWQDKLLPSILLSSKADMLAYGMAEKSLQTLVNELQAGKSIEELQTIPQTAFIQQKADATTDYEGEIIRLHSHEECVQDKRKFAENFRIIETESNRWLAARLVQPTDEHQIIVNPPYPPVNQQELDKVYALPFTRLPHPKYKKKEPIPAYDMIRHSVTLHRGCFGGCSFCTISAHQGKFVASRSEESILKEVEQVTQMEDFKGYLSDLGGPSANMYRMQGKDLALCKKCKRPSCIFPGICKNLDTNPEPLTNLYKKVRNLPTVKKAFVGSGVRYDLFIPHLDKPAYQNYMEELLTHHVSGRLKVAPEHTSKRVLSTMRKPDFKMFYTLKRKFEEHNKRHNLKQQLIPYFISSHPNCSKMDMAELALETKELQFHLEQVQDFTPTPMTLATVMYYTGLNPYTMKPVNVARNKEEKLGQRKFFFWYKKEYQQSIRKDLEKMDRKDLATGLLEKFGSKGGINQGDKKKK
ncbi:MAG: YgiQ family radical SAM protein, partial [Bacteroidota bacterium]